LKDSSCPEVKFIPGVLLSFCNLHLLKSNQLKLKTYFREIETHLFLFPFFVKKKEPFGSLINNLPVFGRYFKNMSGIFILW